MYVNGEMLDRKRLALPSNWEELRGAALELMDRRGSAVEVWGIVCPVSWWYWVALMTSAGGSLVDQEGGLTLGGDAGVRAIEFWQGLVHRDQVMRPPVGRDYVSWQDAMQQFLSGRVAILWSSTAFLRYVEENARFDVRVAPIPGDVRQGVPAGGTFFVITRAAPDAEKRAAWRFLRWMCMPRQANEWATSTGYFPITSSAVVQLSEMGYYAAHPRERTVLSQIQSIEPWPWFPNLFRVQREIMDPMLEECVLQNRDARNALVTARHEASLPG
jgi:sn-glycerol 3-phosphate transport system substrate-binding protein